MIDPANSVDHFVFSPSSSYPKPYARLFDRHGAEVHTWSNDVAQMPAEEDPPSFMRGWNHVEVGPDGCLFAIVPMRALLKLDVCSNLVWQADVSAHHDVALAPGGEVYVLTEVPRQITVDGRARTVVDNAVTVLDASGRPVRDISLLDVLSTDPALSAMVQDQVARRHNRFERAELVLDTEQAALLASGTSRGPQSRALQVLRQLMGEPCDALHTNTLEILEAHPAGLWQRGHVLVSMRNLDLVAVLDLDTPRVLWWWGPGELSAQHQPSALPNGNVLVFDNGVATGVSRALEVDPTSSAIIWEYRASSFTACAGGCELLPSGNVLVTEAQVGRAIEVTRDQQITWQWRTAKLSSGPLTSRATLYRVAGVPWATVEQILRRQPTPASTPGASELQVCL
ncbi:arylsulfotransferase family protein [Streptomyces kronopolitis]|uniref:arylsulfotransferase family protein n=1 Tax=Streptomyces kronopolitis TaxID=1612435 RepID=UPI00369A0CD7